MIRRISTLSAKGTHLYMCNTGTPGGISAFTVDRRSPARSTLLNYIESKGRGPSYVSVDQSGRFVLDANYGGGYVEVLSLNSDGSLKEQIDVRAAHGFERASTPEQTFRALVPHRPHRPVRAGADLGMDQVVIYKFDSATGKLTPQEPQAAR